MRTALHHALAILCSVVLLMPCGWCCAGPVISPQSAKAAATSAPPAETCSCCKRCRPAAPHEPAAPEKCVCVEKTGLIGPERTKVQITLLLVLPIPLDDAPSAVAAIGHAPAETRSSQSLHLRNCVWLC